MLILKLAKIEHSAQEENLLLESTDSTRQTATLFQNSYLNVAPKIIAWVRKSTSNPA